MKLWVQSSSHSFVISIWGACNCQDNYPVCLQLLDSSIPLVSVINAPVQLLTAGLQLFSLALLSFPFAPLLSYKYFKQENGIKPFLLQSLQMICMLFSIFCILSASPAISYFFSTPYLWISVWLHLNYFFFLTTLFVILLFIPFSPCMVHLFLWHNNYWQPGILYPTVANSRCLEKNTRNRVRI